jgi:hypothetical protein
VFSDTWRAAAIAITRTMFNDVATEAHFTAEVVSPVALATDPFPELMVSRVHTFITRLTSPLVVAACLVFCEGLEMGYVKVSGTLMLGTCCVAEAFTALAECRAHLAYSLASPLVASHLYWGWQF